ncbi:excinuclease ABC subunit C [Sphingobacteriales bacterium UPWRP_1]|nr:hypothetical protein BVG80_15225 [Sphingobacteriales bacterium TSM_CSM]PSJ79150.1 excinuclease ABC subunit C [Sphingobacteriales bacterium UPWRP_1]
MWYVYILQSEKDSSFYIGYTQDPQKRLEQHNRGKSTYTSRKLPWKIVYVETYDLKSEALKREKFLKKPTSVEASGTIWSFTPGLLALWV